MIKSDDSYLMDTLDITEGIVESLQKDGAKPIPIRFGSHGRCATVLTARLTHSGNFVMQGDIAKGDGGFAWKCHLSEMHVTYTGRRRLCFTASSQPTVVMYA